MTYSQKISDNTFNISLHEVELVRKHIQKTNFYQFKDYTIILDEAGSIRFRKNKYTLFMVGKFNPLNHATGNFNLVPLSKKRNDKKLREYQLEWVALIDLLKEPF